MTSAGSEGEDLPVEPRTADMIVLNAQIGVVEHIGYGDGPNKPDWGDVTLHNQ